MTLRRVPTKRLSSLPRHHTLLSCIVLNCRRKSPTFAGPAPKSPQNQPITGRKTTGRLAPRQLRKWHVFAGHVLPQIGKAYRSCRVRNLAHAKPWSMAPRSRHRLAANQPTSLHELALMVIRNSALDALCELLTRLPSPPPVSATQPRRRVTCSRTSAERRRSSFLVPEGRVDRRVDAPIGQRGSGPVPCSRSP